MQSQLRNSDWDECSVQYNNGTVTYVYRRAPGELYFEPWVVVGPSAILTRVGTRGLGLYAATAFRRDDYVGQYNGRVVGLYPTRAAALSVLKRAACSCAVTISCSLCAHRAPDFI